jgi:hypothetical protein
MPPLAERESGRRASRSWASSSLTRAMAARTSSSSSGSPQWLAPVFCGSGRRSARTICVAMSRTFASGSAAASASRHAPPRPSARGARRGPRPGCAADGVRPLSSAQRERRPPQISAPRASHRGIRPQRIPPQQGVAMTAVPPPPAWPFLVLVPVRTRASPALRGGTSAGPEGTVTTGDAPEVRAAPRASPKAARP